MVFARAALDGGVGSSVCDVEVVADVDVVAAREGVRCVIVAEMYAPLGPCMPCG